MEEDITIVGLTNFRNKKVKFGIKKEDRLRHFYVIGKTGSGKTTLLENMVLEDIKAGKGVGVVDPHGDFVERLLHFIPENRVDDVVYFNPADDKYPFGFNPLERVQNEYRHLIASGIMGVFKKIWPDVWSARMEYILNNSLLALLEYPGSTLLGIMRLLSEKKYRQAVVSELSDPVVKSFWLNEFANYSQRLEVEATASIQNKVGQFVSNPLIRNIIGQPHSTMDLRRIMDEGKILLVNVSKGRIGEDNSRLLGAMVITKLQLAAMGRVNVPEADRRDFYLYIDEFQNFSTESFANILSEARKYHLNLILAHQYIGQLTDENEKVRDAIFGNVGTIVCFRVGADDAEFLEKEFYPEFTENDLVNLSKYQAYVKLMIDGVSSHPFSAETLEPPPFPSESFADLIIENNQHRYGVPKEMVEKKINEEWGSTTTEIREKAERREEQPLEVLGKPKRDRKPVDKEELQRVLGEILPESEEDIAMEPGEVVQSDFEQDTTSEDETHNQ